MIKKTTISINNYDNHLVISANDASNLIDQAEPRGTFADSFNNPRGRNMFL